MKIKLLSLFLFLSCFFLPFASMGQKMSMGDISSDIKVSQLTDDQIIQAWDKAQAAGLGEKDMYAMLEKKGASPDDIAVLKQRITLLGLTDKTVKKNTASLPNKELNSTRNNNDTIVKPKPLKKQVAVLPTKRLDVYGMQLFNQADLTFKPDFSIATPKNYVLGPDDQIIVILTGLNETTVQPKISPDGNLLLPYAGLVYLNGFTIEQATSIIKAKMSKVYPALKSGQTQLAVNLGSTRSIHVTVNGEAHTPGNFVVSSFTTLFNVLYNAGGPNNNGSLRYIQLIRNNKVYKTIDFYNFLQNGIQNSDIRLEDQDVIHIPVYKKRVGISGEVKSPYLFELKDNETLADLIKYAGGFTEVAYKGVAKVDQINDLQHEVKDVPANMFANYVPRNGDMVTVGAVANRYTNRIVLAGAVYRPGAYELRAGFTLGQLLKDAQGLKPEAYMERGYINRTLPNLDKEIVSFNPADVIAGKNDVPLLREDSVVVLDRTLFASSQNIVVEGYVKSPVTFVYRKGLKLADAIAMAGGFADEAAKHHIEISRIINNKSDSVANQLVRTFTVDMTNEANQNIELEPMDIVTVPRLVNYRALGNVIVKGEVAFPGILPVQKRDETVLEFLSRAGGITPYGSLENTQVYRNGIRVNLDLSTRGVSTAERSKMILLPGDSVFVPRVISYVEVSGAVNNPQYITYKGRRFKYYINAAAGITENARLKGSYIQYPDGLNKPVRHFLFFRVYPHVKPGSRIVVPEKQPDNKLFKVGLDNIGGIAAALTAIVSIIAILHK